jgi:hypothetical protein
MKKNHTNLWSIAYNAVYMFRYEMQLIVHIAIFEHNEQTDKILKINIKDEKESY